MSLAPDSLPPDRWRWWIRVLWGLAALDTVWTFGWTLIFTRQFADAPPMRVTEGLRALGWSNEQFFWFSVTFIAIHFMCAFVVALVIFFLRPDDRMALFTSIFMMAFSAGNAFIPAREYTALAQTGPLISIIPGFINGVLAWSLLVFFFALFPDGQFVPRWTRYVATYFFCFNVIWNLFPAAFTSMEGPVGVIALFSALLMFGSSLYAQVWRYRHHSTALQRQQTKWLLYGFTVIVATMVLPFSILYFTIGTGAEVTSARTSVVFDLVLTVANALFIFWPLSLGVAILRYRLWDIDLLIRRTLVYSVLSGLLALTYFGTVIVLQSVFTTFGGGQSELATVLSTLIIAALFFPLRGRVQGVVDRRFYRKKYDAAKTLADFAATARDEVELEKLTARLIGVVDETMQPETLGLRLQSFNTRSQLPPARQK